MIKKIFFQSIFLSFLFSKEAFAAESDGMPQLNPEFWISQIFWLTITFGILYLFFLNLYFQKLAQILKQESHKLLENIEAAENKEKKVN